ncbi:glucosamine-6-phosphate deaminase [Atopostipes suicloacalis DSM 15692]|uniref:Glucosamine-6-phosphate deaminase n=1 Tax=Atopostipes suicloacalis DSM 15692 TaxID=1121025 RepID=A0A1M4S5F7_9LACT|nr:glucosamine-6-phosphate deaminase [Atopostipes suicloacalis DSM 15692]
MNSNKNIEVVVVKDAQEGGKKAFEYVKQSLEEGMKVMGLATGSTPETLYTELRNSDLDFSNVTAINLDEYIGLPGDHDQSYSYFMNENLFKAKPFKETHIPNGLASEEEETARYNKVIEDHPIDLQILGIGTNAHVGFNEPGSSFDSLTRKVELTEETIEANKRFFESADDVPRYAYSMGLASIMSADKIMLLAYGENKAEAVANAVNGPVTEEVPASILQKHKDVVFIVDEAAASKL